MLVLCFLPHKNVAGHELLTLDCGQPPSYQRQDVQSDGLKHYMGIPGISKVCDWDETMLNATDNGRTQCGVGDAWLSVDRCHVC